MSGDREYILELDHVTVEAQQEYDSGVWDVTLRLRRGELALVRLERGHVRLPIADAAGGLVEPQHGSVRFLGTDWAELFPDDAASRRGRIGRVFDFGGWVSNLEVDENVLLARRHHTSLPHAQLADEAARLARTFGLPGLPRGRPGAVRAADLQRAAFVRAFAGQPDLVLLERPTQGVYPEAMPPLMHTIRAALKRGAAVLWTTADAAVWNDRGIRPALRAVMSGAQLLVAEDPNGATPDAGGEAARGG